MDLLELELQVVVSHRVGAGNPTWVLYKSSKNSSALSHFSSPMIPFLSWVLGNSHVSKCLGTTNSAPTHIARALLSLLATLVFTLFTVKASVISCSVPLLFTYLVRMCVCVCVCARVHVHAWYVRICGMNSAFTHACTCSGQRFTSGVFLIATHLVF